MNPAPIPEDIRRFLWDHIETTTDIEVVRILHRQPDRSWTAAETAREARIQAEAADRVLKNMAAAGVLERAAEATEAYRFSPRSPALSDLVRRVIETYMARPVSVVSAIHSKPPDAIRKFSDAFRIRKEE